jgi:hypothetical protein
MTLYFDRRLRRFVTVPGLDGALETLTLKAGDVEEVVVQFGRSPDGAAPNSVVTAPSWTAENIGAGALIDIGIKASGDYSDGVLLAGTSAYVHDSVAKTYTFNLSLNTTEINTELHRLDTHEGNDIASIDDCLFELTYKYSAGADYQSSIDDVVVTIKHDVLGGSEGTPVNATDPDEYSLISNTIQFLADVNSLTGGTSSDLDSVATVSRELGEAVAFFDGDSSDVFRVYELISSTDAESEPDTIRPDDYDASTNARVWKLRNSASSIDISNYSLISNTIQHFPNLTGLTGGTSTDLDSILTVSRSIGEIVDLTVGNDLRIYELQSGTTAESSPETIRPDDYAASTNEKIWTLLSTNGGGGGASLPVDDTTSIARDPADNTKQARLDVGQVTTGNTRALQVPDGDAKAGLVVMERELVASGVSASAPSYHDFGVIGMPFTAVALEIYVKTQAESPVEARMRKNQVLAGNTAIANQATNGTDYDEYGTVDPSVSFAAGDEMQVAITDDGTAGSGSTVAAGPIVARVIGYYNAA